MIRHQFNIYCDESCHLENDNSKSMVLGAIICPSELKKEVTNRIREIKVRNGLPSYFEIKWNKVSNAKANFYQEIVDYYFDVKYLNFRALVVPDKSIIDHKAVAQTHDEFYYKMYFDMLKVIFEPHSQYFIYLDIKDTRSSERIKVLQEILSNSPYAISRSTVQRIQHIRSHESELLQLADLLIGALGYFHRGLHGNEAKIAIIETITRKAGFDLKKSALYREKKFNQFIWDPKYGRSSYPDF